MTNPAFSKGYQVVRDDDGRIVGYRSQPRDPVSGQRVSITAKTEAEMVFRLEELQSARRAKRMGAPLAEVRSRMAQRVVQLRRCDDWAREWLSTRPTRRSTWERRCRAWFGRLTVLELTRSLLERWAAELEAQGYAPKSIEDAYAVLGGVVRCAIDAGEVDALPWGRWRPARGEARTPREAARSVAEFLRLVTVVQQADRAAWTRGWHSVKALTVIVLGFTGMRQGEAAGLGWDDVDIDGPEPHVRIQWQVRRGWRGRYSDRPRDATKGRRARVVPLNAAAVSALRLMRSQLEQRGRYRSDGPVWPASGSEWRDVPRVLNPQAMHRWALEAGLPHPERWVVHSMRHTFATLEERGGAGLRELAAKTGHSDLRTLETYLQGLRGAGLARIEAIPEGVLELPPGPEPANHQAHELPEALPLVPKPKTPRDVSSFPELAREWLADGGPQRERQPWEATHAARLAYSRGYQRSRYRHPEGPRERWQEAGSRSRRGCLGAWGKALAEAERREVELEDEQAPPSSAA